ncbi:MAG: HEAT repeat domain-containing protein [Treponema sp.]|nr:HEAT repeat domain-containing protein [Treponema sp.]
MAIFKRMFVLGVVFVMAAAVATAQTAPGRALTVEESYLLESIEAMIIREQSRSPSRDMKMVALEYIGDAIERGNRGPEILSTLEFLALEGVRIQSRESGRLINNFPDVRVRAATRLGQMGTAEARDVLISMVLADNEPMVIAEAVRSLGVIGLNENDVTASAISWAVARFDIINPDNLLALSALEAYERLAVASGGFISPVAISSIIRIADGNYVRPVRDRARALLSELRVGAAFR